MDKFLMKDLGGLIGDEGEGPRYRTRFGVVSAIASNGTVSVDVGGTGAVIAGIKCLRSYVPVVGDTVVMQCGDTDMMVLGTLGDHRKRYQANKVTIPETNAGETSSVHVDFAVAFAAQPSVVVSPVSTAPQARLISVYNVTASGFDVYYRNAGTVAADLTVFWQASAMTQ